MVNYREILRLKSLKYSNTDIASSIHSSRNTVQEVLRLSEALHIQWPLEDDVTNLDLEAVLYPERHKKDENRLIPDYPKVHRELAKPGVTLTLLWTEYCAEAAAAGKKPYMSTQFSDGYRRWNRATKATMRITHKPGAEMEVDWAGNTLDIYDQVTGEATETYLFVAALPCSCFAYAELCTDMQQGTFIRCHVHAYSYFGGTTRILRPDNLKAGITKNTRYETLIPRAYQEMANYYNTAIAPARVRAPQDKGHVEGSVKYASTWILAALRNYHFFSFSEAKKAVAEKLEELNSRPFEKRAGNRRTAFDEEEREFMQPLPDHPYEPAVWSTAKVQNDYLISDGRNKYSVPYDLIGETVDIRTTEETVEVFFKGNRIATHVRHKNRERDPIVIKDHMPLAHQKYLEYTPEDFTAWARSVGDFTEKTIACFLNAGKVPEQGYKYCVGLMKAADRYTPHRVENACRRLLSATNKPSLRNIIMILKNGQDRLEISHSETSARPRSHGITRGVEAYRQGGDQ